MNGPPSPTPIEAPGFFAGIRPVAIALGALVDQIGTTVLNVLLLSSMSDAYETSPGVIDEQALQALARDPDMLAAWLCIGTFGTCLGGFMSARMAARHHARHGAFVGLAGIILGLFAYSAQQSPYPPPLWYDLLSFTLLVPAGALGGLISSRVSPGAEAPDEGDVDVPSRDD